MSRVGTTSLDAVVAAGSVESYEVWPDRVVTYLWPRPGGVRFSFLWRPRLAISVPIHIVSVFFESFLSSLVK